MLLGKFSVMGTQSFTCKTYCLCNLGSHFGQLAIEAFIQGGALGFVIACSDVDQWWYTIGLRTNQDLYIGGLFMLILSAISLRGGWYLQLKSKMSVSWFKNVEFRLNHHLSGLFEVTWIGNVILNIDDTFGTLLKNRSLFTNHLCIVYPNPIRS